MTDAGTVRSWKRDEELFRLRIEKVFGDKKLDAIDRKQIQSFHTALLAEGLAPASCDHHVKLIRQSLNLAVEWEMLEKIPASKVPLFNVDNKVEHYLDDDQLQRLLTVLRSSITARGGAQGGDGGLIETSGHWLDVAGIKVNASAPNGKRGMWLLDPADVTIQAGTTNGTFSGGNPDVFTPAPGAATATVDVATIVGDAATGLTGGTSITINTANNGIGNGDITVASPITWTRTAPGPASTLTLNAVRDVNINAAITPTFGNLVVCCGRDIRVNAAITTVDGSVLLSAGRDIFMGAAMTTTRGNITMCAGHDVNVTGKIVLTDFADFQGLAAAQNTGLGLANGLVLSAGNDGTGPGVAGGTVIIAPRVDPAEITRAPVTIIYNPTSYATPTDYSPATFFVRTSSPLTQYMLVFPGGRTKPSTARPRQASRDSRVPRSPVSLPASP